MRVRSSTCVLSCLLVAAISTVAAADSKRPDPDKTLSPYFEIEGGDASIESMPLEATHADVHIVGVISDVVVSIDNGHTTFGYDQRIEVFGSTGMIATENDKPHSAQLTDSTGSHAVLPWHFFIERYVESYARELRAFVDCIEQRTEPLVTAVDGRRAVVIAFAAQRSYDESRPVSISEIE
jgi:myo-inositol 2-dehydrogenase/D-chiro-inositol 1-dehydrogenase